MSNTHRDVAINWMAQTGKAWHGFNMFYEQDEGIIYSYGRHFPIARHTRTDQGEAIVLFTTAEWSVSTAKHKTIVQRAILRRNTILKDVSVTQVFYVPNIGIQHATDRTQNAYSYRERIEAALKRADRAKVYTQLHLDSAEGLRIEGNKYLEAFPCSVKRLHSVLK